jgi:hypothetical protein
VQNCYDTVGLSDIAGKGDPSEFDSLTEFKQYLSDEAIKCAATHATHLWQLGFRSFAAIARIGLLDSMALQKLIDPRNLDPVGVEAVSAFADSHASKLAKPAHAET